MTDLESVPSRAPLVSRLKGRLNYAGWGLADQAMSSLSNFGVGLVAVRSSSAEEYGAFSIAFATSVIGIGVARALVSDVYSVRFAGGGPRVVGAAPLDTSLGAADPEVEWIEAEEELLDEGADVHDPVMDIEFPDEEAESRYPHASGAWGAALVLSLFATLGCLVVGLLSSGSLRPAMLILAVGMPFLVLQDVVRFVCITRRDPFGAAMSDTTWVVAFAVGIAAIHVATGDAPGANTALAAWLFGAACAALVGGVRMGAVPRIGEGIEFARLVWRQSMRYVLDWLAVGAGPQAGLYLLGITAGLAVLGEARTAFLLTGPINIVIMGASMLAVPQLTRHRRRTGSRLVLLAVVFSLALEIIALAWLGVVALLPDSLLQAILGDGATDARGLLLPLVFTTSMIMLSQGPLASLRATGDVRRGTRATVPAAPFMVLGASIGAAVTGDASGAVFGVGLGYVVSGSLGAVQLVKATRSAPIVFNHVPDSTPNS